MGNFIAYLRVSTDRQGRSGLGLDAQRAAVERFLGGGDRLIRSYVEVESGSTVARPELQAALEECRRTGSILLVAKLDRLARDVYFISGLMKSGVEFRAADMPTTDPFMLHVQAAFAEEERRRISARTKAALAAARARGVKLGGGPGRRFNTDETRRGATASAKSRSQRAVQFAAQVLPIVTELQAQGVVSLRALAKALTERAVPTPRGGSLWRPFQVKRVLMAA